MCSSDLRLMGTFQSDGGMRLMQNNDADEFQKYVQEEFWSKVWGRYALGKWPIFNGMPEEKIEDLVSLNWALMTDTSSKRNLYKNGLFDIIQNWEYQTDTSDTPILLLLTNANETNKHTTWKWFKLTEDEAKSWFPRKADSAIRCTAKFTNREKDRIVEHPFVFDYGFDLYNSWVSLRVVVLSPYFFIQRGDAYFWDVLVTQRLDGLSTDEIQAIANFSVVRE